MKKLLLSASFFGYAFLSTSQVVFTDNFENYTSGNFVTTNPIIFDLGLDNSTQGSWTFSTSIKPPSSSSLAQIEKVNTNNQLTLKSAADSVGIFVLQKNLDFSNRLAKNGLIFTNFKLNTGVATNSKCEFGVYFTVPKPFTYALGFSYAIEQKEVIGVLLNDTTVAGKNQRPYAYKLSADSEGLILEANTEYFCEFVYDLNNAVGHWYVSKWETKKTPIASGGIQSKVLLTTNDVSQLAIMSVPHKGNKESHTISIDEINVGCKSTLEEELTAGLQSKDFPLANFSISPNPATDMITVRFSDLTKVNDEIRLTSMDGKVIETRRITGVIENFDVNSLQSGMYLFQIGDVTQKIVVQ